jgi:N-acetylglucosaminyldiphosphoundecaprenol N-acetyl-beta-D-mannosaminyltransferase
MVLALLDRLGHWLLAECDVLREQSFSEKSCRTSSSLFRSYSGAEMKSLVGYKLMQASMIKPVESAKSICQNEILNVPITCASLDETVAFVDYAIRNRQPIQHVSMNVAKLVAMRSDATLSRDVRSSDIVGVDGMGLYWATRLLGIKVPERVAGIDLMDALLELCARNSYRPYLLGARPEILEKAVANILGARPSIDFAGWHHGYFSADEEAGIVEQIASSRADCLFVGFPSPKKERFLARYRQQLDVPFVMGVGGSIDVFAGTVRRAPKTVQMLGLEWLFRTVQEPLRLGPRYLKTNAIFTLILAKALLGKYLKAK